MGLILYPNVYFSIAKFKYDTLYSIVLYSTVISTLCHDNPQLII